MYLRRVVLRMFSDGGIVIDGDYDVCDTTDLISILITDLSSD